MQGRTVHWLVQGEQTSPLWLVEYDSASIRLRAGVAHDFLRNQGWSSTAGEIVSGNPQILVVGKIGAGDIDNRRFEWSRKIRESKSQGSLILVDYTDHHLGFESPMSTFYRDVLALADVVVCPSDTMRRMLEKHWSGRIEVIEDAIEVQPIAPKMEIHEPVTMLWFGHASNTPYLAEFIRKKSPKAGEFKLIALTNRAGALWLKTQNLLVPPNLGVEVSPWSVQAMVEASKRADLCIIPSDVRDPKKMGVSVNRLITAFALGLPVAADHLGSYVEFKDYYVDINSEAFSQLLGNPLAFGNQVVHAQRDIVPKFGKAVIAEKWKLLLENLASTQ